MWNGTLTLVREMLKEWQVRRERFSSVVLLGRFHQVDDRANATFP